MSSLHTLGRFIGNRNDRKHPGDTAAERGRIWRSVDRLARWLYLK